MKKLVSLILVLVTIMSVTTIGLVNTSASEQILVDVFYNVPQGSYHFGDVGYDVFFNGSTVKYWLFDGKNAVEVIIPSIEEFAGPTEIPYVEFILGDVDNSGEITILDVTAIQRMLAKISTFTDSQIEAGDTNKDGEVDILDATTIQRLLAKKITEF